MPRYWVMAPYRSDDSAQFENVWQFDRSNNLISIGWSGLGDVSKMTREQLGKAAVFSDNPPQTNSLIANMLWAFYHEITPGDFVVARKGRKVLVGVGQVDQAASYHPSKNPSAEHSGFLGVRWQENPSYLAFSEIVFPMHTLTEISEPQFHNLLAGGGAVPPVEQPSEKLEDPNAFVLEKYLEDFIVTNFQNIFKGKLTVYEDAAGNFGQQYSTDIGSIDILATEPQSGAFVVIELKKGRPSDQVVGQILRYMGWVKQNLCKPDQKVKGLIICQDRDARLDYALTMTKDIDVKYYHVSFKLYETP